VSPPAVIIRLEFERPPVVYADYLTEGDEVRMRDWLLVHPRWADLVNHAQELAAEAKAA
jgi:hypothetical protein